MIKGNLFFTSIEGYHPRYVCLPKAKRRMSYTGGKTKVCFLTNSPAAI